MSHSPIGPECIQMIGENEFPGGGFLCANSLEKSSVSHTNIVKKMYQIRFLTRLILSLYIVDGVNYCPKISNKRNYVFLSH